MQKPIPPSEARAKLTEYFDAARRGDFTRARELAEELERFIDWAEENCPAVGGQDELS